MEPRRQNRINQRTELLTDPTGLVTRCLNLGSYNYLGYAEVPGGVHSSVRAALSQYGAAACDVSVSTGRSAVLRQLERTVADFLGKQDAIVVGMGFATNSQPQGGELADLVGEEVGMRRGCGEGRGGGRNVGSSPWMCAKDGGGRSRICEAFLCVTKLAAVCWPQHVYGPNIAVRNVYNCK